MKEIYNQLKNKLKEVNFTELWPGFKGYDFALYDEFKVITDDSTMNWDMRFIGNTAIHFEGKWLAIWNMDTIPANYDLDLLCANMVHEMFHCFQQEKNERKYANEISGLEYPMNSDNFVLKVKEKGILLKAYLEKNNLKKYELLKNFISIRTKRKALIGDAILYEYAIESFEGVAVYTEFKALKQCSNEKIQPYLVARELVDKDILKIRENSYLPGMLLALIMDDLTPEWKNNFIEGDNYIYDLLSQNIGIYNYPIDIDGDIRNQVNIIIKEKNIYFHQLVDSLMQNKDVKEIVENYFIIGFDPLNMVKQDDLIYHSHMVKVKIDNNERLIKGPVLTVVDKSNILKGYKIIYLND